MSPIKWCLPAALGFFCTLPLIAANDTTLPAASAPSTASAPAPVDLSSFILTPPPPLTPRIHGPKIFGVRPGHPFLYTIPATGQQPKIFSAKNLPNGLQLDSATGHITGTLDNPGEYHVTLAATNALGTTEKEFKIVVGDQIALTPPMGWNSWNCWASAVDQDKVLRSAKAMVASGLIDHGWTYINIDDKWQGKRGGPLNALQPNPTKFPDIKAMCDDIHAMGLKVGIYSTPWVRSYAGELGGSAENPEGDLQKWPGKPPRNKKVLPYAVGKYSFAAVDAKQWGIWGFDYLKYDWNPIEVPQIQEISDALRASGRDMILSLSNQAPIALSADYIRLANAWRTTNDIRDNWGVVRKIGFEQQEKWTAFAGPGHWNDTDMLVVGWVGWGPQLHASKLTPDEQYTHISLWCLLAAPMLIGCDLDRLDPFTLNLLTNDEVLAVDQDTLGKQGSRISQDGDVQVYAKELEDGSHAVGLFNLGSSPATGTLKWTDLKINGSQTVRDLWRQKSSAPSTESSTLKFHRTARCSSKSRHPAEHHFDFNPVIFSTYA